MIELLSETILYKSDLAHFQRGDISLFLDGASPNWVATDPKGAWILSRVDGETPFRRILEEYQKAFDLSSAKAWLDLHEFIREALRVQMLFSRPVLRPAYLGRAQYLKPQHLSEFWMHVTQTCNLSCAHCLVSSHPKGERGQSFSFYKRAIEEAADLGVRRFYFTGGEPFTRQDLLDLIQLVTEKKQAELIILTNATLLGRKRLKELQPFSAERLKFQVSLDGATPEVNDAIRGVGCFLETSEGVRALAGLGFEVSLTAVATRSNLEDLAGLPALAKKLGAKSVHLMWMHNRGRVLEEMPDDFPTTQELVGLIRQVRRNCREWEISLDNEDSWSTRLKGQPGKKYDYSMACWESLCMYMDGNIYPSAAMAGYPDLKLGDARRNSLKSIWLDSPIAGRFREKSLIQQEEMLEDPFRFLTGGGDLEHTTFFNTLDPYYPLYVETMKDLMEELALQGKRSFNLKSGYRPPVIYYAMGQEMAGVGATKEWLETEDKPVLLQHSNCVLAFDVEKPYRVLREFYGKAAVEPQKELCCPVKYEDQDTSHIPKEVLERFYGCGSPVGQAGLKSGEVFVDLGSGGGIDCFIAAKKTGPEGKVVGVDMTEEMLSVALENKRVVAKNLGYDVVEFRKGYLEKVPVEDGFADVVSSNCVINLSPDKRKVFAQMWRILKDHGRIVISDIVSDRPVPAALQANEKLWGECISGALSEEEFLAFLEQAGFYGLRVLKKMFWKEESGFRFYALTLCAYKYGKKAGCTYIGQKAIYHGPFKAVMDEEGHLFPRGEAVEVCTDTASKLSHLPYIGQFTVVGQQRADSNPEEVPVAGEGCGPGCC
ncbi:MAG: methyltransferase domain-containing protein [Elusimicrobia bacterium]|nr:methyltransferase domain-containing protein [Elusimicrobiota bacterium]